MFSKKKPDQSHVPWSLAIRLTCWFSLFSFLIVSITTGFLYHTLVVSLDQNYDRQLDDDIGSVRLLIERHQSDELRWEVEDEAGTNKTQESYLRIIDENSGVNLESRGMDKILPVDVFEQNNEHMPGSSRGINYLAVDGREFRLLFFQDRVNEKRCVIHAAIDRSDDKILLESFRKEIVVVITLALIICGLSGYWISRQGIKPIFTIAETAAHVHSSTLSDRIPTAGLPLELHNLADTMNAMLSRLEDSFNRLSQFSADIAHELRTPAQNLRGLVEVALTASFTTEKSRELLVPCLDECRRLSLMVDNLLFLAKSENPRTTIDSRPLNAKQELATIWEYYEAVAVENNIHLSFESEDDLNFSADRLLLQRALGNLIENALKHTPSGGSVSLRASRKENSISIEVSDTGCGIEQKHLPFLFDRLYRIDVSRSESSKGAGLGLAIVKAIVSLHGGSVGVESVCGSGSTFALLFPMS
ncbi:MAG: heavy metal sensor histidine kinase [Candidatus Riflebacteria bacterium]|nr:heavy metal sensor histidine kinase [Candidatus Riflebacteria bacterium]